MTMPDPTLFPPAQVRPAHSASERVSRVKAFGHAAHVAGMQKLDAMRKAGQELIALKDELPHGEFLPYLAKHMPDTPTRTLRYWMSCAKHWKRVQNAATHAEAEEVILECEESFSDDFKLATVANLESGNDEPKSKPGKEKEPKPPETPPVPETPEGRIKRKVSNILDQLAEVNLDMEDVIGTPIGLRALDVAEELKLEVMKEWVGQEDAFGRESDTKGERHYLPRPVKELIQWWTTFLSRLENPSEVDF